MTGDRHVRFYESGRGRFPPATHQVPRGGLAEVGKATVGWCDRRDARLA